MNEPTMPIRIYSDTAEIGHGDLLPNGTNLAMIVAAGTDLLPYEADTEKVEARIPLEIRIDDKLVSCGELYHSGEYYCLAPSDQNVDLSGTISDGSTAELWIDAYRQLAKLDITAAANLPKA